MTLFLSGPMGAGKTTLAKAYAKSHGGSVVDLDDALTTRHGKSVAAIFRERGEPAFRAVERQMARELAAGGHAVVALGGGTVTDRETRRALLRDGIVVTLVAPIDVLVQRLSGDTGRPMLDGTDDRAGVLDRILQARADAYAECHATLDTSAMTQAQLLAAIDALVAARPLVMPLGTRSYPIHVGRGTLAERSARELDRLHASSVVVVSDENVRAYARAATERSKRRAIDVVLTPGESNKTIAAVETIWNAALDARVDRHSVLLAVGGGVVGDLAGFAAATLLRGVSFGQIPTSLLAMVDASVGGKTGFDRAQGKNLVGAFHQPSFVVADLDTLATLPERELVSGLAEVVKSAWLTSEEDVSALEADASALRARDVTALERAVRRSIATKIAIVAEDEHELGARAHLNLGHTLGHAIEAASDYTRTHGESVALGLIAAMRIGVALGDARRDELERMTRLLTALGLPVDVDAALASPRVASFLASDKKRVDGTVRFVVPGAPGAIRIERLETSRVLALARR